MDNQNHEHSSLSHASQVHHASSQNVNDRLKDILLKMKNVRHQSQLGFGYLIATLLSLAFMLISFLTGKLSLFVTGSFPLDIGWLSLAVAFFLSLQLCLNKYEKISYLPLLVWIVFVSVWLRSLPMNMTAQGHPGLWDVTTNTWTLGPDLDPFLFLRWAKYIVENGHIMSNDAMRYVPIGFNTKEEMILLPTLMAWFHKFAQNFGSNSMEYSAVVYPVFMFALTIVAFFLFVRKLFIDELGENKANVISLISSIILTLSPSLLPRTIAGIPEKESTAFLFMFLAFFFFLSAWKEKNVYKRYIYAILAGVSTAAMALIWGGFAYIMVTIGLSFFLVFIIGQVDWQKWSIYTTWLIISFAVMNPFSARYSVYNLLTTPVTGPAFLVLILVGAHLLIYNSALKRFYSIGRLKNVPPQIISFVVLTFLAVLLVIIAIGPTFLVDNLKDIMRRFVTPVVDRLNLTVAENRQPFFNEWSSSFGPMIGGIPIFFWLFFIGSVYLYYNMMKILDKKHRIITTIGYLLFLTGLIFSRYQANNALNGTSHLSLLVYFLSFIVLLFSFGLKGASTLKKEKVYYYSTALFLLSLLIWSYGGHDSTIITAITGILFLQFAVIALIFIASEENLKSLDYGIIVIFTLFFFSIVSARSAVRLIMLLVPPTAIIVSYFLVSFSDKAIKTKDETMRWIMYAVALIFILATFNSVFQSYRESKTMSERYIPSIYTQQWQYAMQWVRDNTPTDAVFGHWWDYGYWLQSIGNRATVLDGGNAVSYWNHFMGRYALTGPSSREAAEFLYAHNTTHFLIDSTDIGKYSAFSTIGSDIHYDRASWISTFERNNQMSTETKNTTVTVYQIPRGNNQIGVNPNDGDIIYYQNETKIFLPAGKTGVLGVVIEVNHSGEIASQPEAIFMDQSQKQIRLPIRFVYKNKLIDYKTGVDVGIFLMPRLVAQQQGIGIENDGVLLFLSNRTVSSQLARLFLYDLDDPYFKLVHTEDDILIKNIKAQGNFTGNFLFDGVYTGRGVVGPIKIWEIEYPKDIQFKKEFLVTTYPRELLLSTP